MVPAEAQNEMDARLPPGLLTSTLVMSLKTTLYDQVLVEIYERAGVTSFLHGHLPNYHKATRKMLMSGHGLLGADYSRSPPNYRTFRRQAERVSEVEKAKVSPAVLEVVKWLNLAIKMPKYQNETLMNIINPEVKVLMRDEKRVSSDSFNGWRTCAQLLDAKSPKLHRRSHLQRPTHLLISPPIPQRRLLLNTPINALPQQAFNEKSPTRVKCSLYEYARSKATDEPETWSDVHYVCNELVNNPDCSHPWLLLMASRISSLFTALSEKSFLRTDGATGDVTFVLKRNHRARRHAAEFVIEAFCGRDISIVYRDPTENCTAPPFSMLIEYLEERQSFIEISVKVNFTMRAIMCENCIQPDGLFGFLEKGGWDIILDATDGQGYRGCFQPSDQHERNRIGTYNKEVCKHHTQKSDASLMGLYNRITASRAEAQSLKVSSRKLRKPLISHDDAGEEIGFGDVGSDTYNDDAGKGIDHQQVALHSSSQGTYRGIGGEKQRPKLVLGKEFTPRAIVTVSDWNRFLTDDPILSNKSIHDSHIIVGKLNVTLPLTMEQIKLGVTEQRTERCANAPVYFRLYPQLRNWLYLWTWKDEGGSNLHSDNVRLDSDMDDVKIRAEAIYN
ncbi:hypothetical protein BKA60DRAFT_606492 [Fusarium oxysporum]|nr:hypothetical protein BKA60DRAFT_606492 [Fusarium oxysporum]